MKRKLMHLVGFCIPLLAAAQTNYTPQQGDKVTTNDGIYIVSGGNLIENPSFDEGLACWTAGDGSDLSSENFSVESSGGADGGAFLKALGGAGSGTNKSVKTGWAIEAGKTYLFSCWALRTSSGMSSNTQYSRVFESDSKTATTSQIGTIDYVADTWTQTTIVFTATKNYCVVNLGWLNTASSFDCFFLGEVTASSELATEKLSQLVAEAEQLYSTTEEGEAKGQFTATVRATFWAAIEAADSVLANATTQEEINSAASTLQSAISTYEEAKNPPFSVGGKYVIRHRGSELYMTTASASGKAVYISAFSNSDNQIFVFESVPDEASATGYNLRDIKGNYVYRSGSWDLFSGAATLTEANAIFNVVEDGDWYQIKNMGSGSVLGTDGVADGSYIYSNKNGSGVPKNDWMIEEYSVTMNIDAAIAQAEELIAESTVGEEPGDVPLSAVDALRSAINVATNAKATVTTYEEADEVASILRQAIEVFNNSVVPISEFDTTKVYAITHNSGNVLTATESGNATITELASADEDAAAQRMTLESVGDLQYRIKSHDGRYLAKSGDYNTVWQEDGTTTETVFQVVQLKGQSVGLMCMDNNKYLGTDATVSGSSVYSDKAGENNENAYWTITEYRLKTTVDKTALDDAISEASALASQMKQGWKAGEYFLSDINAFSDTISNVEAGYDALATQEQVDAATAQLTTAIATYKAKAHAEDVSIGDYLNDLLPIYEAECNNAIVGDEYGQYPVEARDAYAAAIASARSATAVDESTVEAIENARKVFLGSMNKTDFTALKSELAKATDALSAAQVGDCQGQFSKDAVDVLAAAIATAQAVLTDSSIAQSDVDAATEVLATAIKTFEGQAVVIDYEKLRTAIATAEKAIEDAEDERGSGAGKYPDSAFQALQSAIDSAEVMVNSTSVNQRSVDEMTEYLNSATEAFGGSRTPNNYDDLQNALNQAQALYDEWAVRSDLNSDQLSALADLKYSIDRNKDVLSSTSQDDIDRATKILLRDIELFQNVTSGITAIHADSLSGDLVYDLNGRRVKEPSRHGIYIVKGRKVAK